jgi:glucosamine--fructose-6-phosphate aminotransferase (isomerizing)
MAADIAEQPEVFARLLAHRPAISAVAEQIRDRRPRQVIFTARGTSDHAALYAAYLTEIRLGIPAGLASPSAITVYGARPDLRDCLIVGVSQSGGSPDLTEVLRVGREQGALTLAVTNAPDSTLAGTADLHVDVQAGPERAVAATKTYTAELLALYLLVDSIAGGEANEVADLPDLAARTLSDGAARDIAGRYRFADRVITTGRGYAYPTARECALKLMETSYLAALAFSGADLLHGPLAMADRQVPVFAIVSDGPAGRSMGDVLDRLRSRGADLMVVGASEQATVRTPAVDESIAPMLDILPLQRLALELALARGEDPDAPRGLHKVTATL